MARSAYARATVFALALGMVYAALGSAQNVPARPRHALSGPEQLVSANAIVSTLTSTRRSVSEMLDHARQQHDALRVNCLDDKLTQIDVTLRTAHERVDELQTAIGVNNDPLRQHDYAQLVALARHGEGLHAEARRCIGESPVTARDGTTVTVQQDPRIPAYEPSYPSEPIEAQRPFALGPGR